MEYLDRRHVFGNSRNGPPATCYLKSKRKGSSKTIIFREDPLCGRIDNATSFSAMYVSPALSPSLPAFLKAPGRFEVKPSANINTMPFPSSGWYRLRPSPIDRPEGADLGAERER